MYGSTFGNVLKISTWGESHGKAIGVVIDGCPAGLPLCEEDIQREPLLYETDIPSAYLINFGKTLCKKHMAILTELDPEMTKYYKKETFLTKGNCVICKEEERRK